MADSPPGHERVDEGVQHDNSAIATQPVQITSPRKALSMLASNPSLADRQAIFRSIGDQLLGPRPPTETVIKTGLLPVLIENLSFPNSVVRYYCALALTSIVSGSDDQVHRAVEAGVIRAFLSGVDSEHPSTVEWCWKGLAIGAGNDFVDHAIQCGMVDKFVEAVVMLDVANITDDLGLNLALALSEVAERLCVHIKHQTNREIQNVIMPCLVELMKTRDDTVKEHTCYAMGHLCANADEKLILQFGFNILDFAVSVLKTENEGVVNGALFICSGFVKSSTKQALYDAGFLGCFQRLFNFEMFELHVELCDVLSVVLEGGEGDVQAIFDAGIIPFLMDDLEHDEFDVKYGAVTCFGKIESRRQLLQLGNWGLISVITPLLSYQYDEFQQKILIIIENVLSAAHYHFPESDELSQFMDQFEAEGGLGLLDNVRLTGTDETRSIAHYINCFFTASDAA